MIFIPEKLSIVDQNIHIRSNVSSFHEYKAKLAAFSSNLALLSDIHDRIQNTSRLKIKLFFNNSSVKFPDATIALNLSPFHFTMNCIIFIKNLKIYLHELEFLSSNWHLELFPFKTIWFIDKLNILYKECAHRKSLKKFVNILADLKLTFLCIVLAVELTRFLSN